jgi:hypothetical protein
MHGPTTYRLFQRYEEVLAPRKQCPEAIRSMASRTFSFELPVVAEFPGRPSQNFGAVMERFEFCG